MFTGRNRMLNTEEEISLTSVGLDIGSTTSQLVFSRIDMARLGTRYAVNRRELLFESAMRLTPYVANSQIDAATLGAFVDAQYAAAGLTVDDVDSGVLILTGVAAQRGNARAIGEALAASAGKLVAVTAGDALEAALTALGAGAVALSRAESLRVMAVDVGGGTAKIAVCEDGQIVDRTVVDIGARIVELDESSRLVRIEQAGHRLARDAGIALAAGEIVSDSAARQLAEHSADVLFEAMGAAQPTRTLERYLRLPPLTSSRPPDTVMFSGGVAEYLHGREQRAFGDLGLWLADAIRARAAAWRIPTRRPTQGIRATVLGASQYTVQVSGATIFVSPHETLPLRNVMVVRPRVDLTGESIDERVIARSIHESLDRLGVNDIKPLALCFDWQGSADFARLDAFCRGIIAGVATCLAAGLPLVVITDADVGGLIGIHCRSERALDHPIVSIDGIMLGELDFIDIGELIESSGAVPVVVKSLQFGTSPH